MSVPHRSHFIESFSEERTVVVRNAETTGVTITLDGGFSTPTLYGACHCLTVPVGTDFAMELHEGPMSLLNQHFGTSPLTLVTESVDPVAFFKKAKVRTQLWLRQRLCFAVNGGHELYRAHSDTKIYQQCLLCGHQTTGWTIDRRDRRLHIVTSTPTAARR